MNQLRYVAGLLVPLIGFTAAGCGGSTTNAQPQPGMPGQPYSAPTGQRQGMSTRNKVLLLAGAAAVYYLYQKHKNREGQGPQGRYFRSKNGRVYYRDLKTGQFQWVDPPQQPISVPADEYQRYFGGRGAPQRDGGVIRQAPPEWSDPTYR